MYQGKDRRSFIKKGLAIAAGIGILTKAKSITQAQKLAACITGNSMPKRKLGKTDHDVSLLGLGGQGTLDNHNRIADSLELINRAIDLGVNLIETSSSYGPSEEHIGEVMKYRRKEVFLASKSGWRTYDGMMSSFEQSLERLQTDYIDLYQIHNVRIQSDLDSIFANNGAIQALEKLKSEGSIGCIGLTGHYDPIILKKCIEQYEFDCIEMPLNAGDIHYLPFQCDLLDTAVEQNLGIIAMKVAARGRIFRRNGITSMEQALGYVYSLPISTAIVGIQNIRFLEENVTITRNFKKFTEKQMHDIAQLTVHYQEEVNLYKYGLESYNTNLRRWIRRFRNFLRIYNLK
jgi:uncharacterized protein